MGKHRDEIWQELNDHDARLSALEDRAILKPEYDPADVAFNRAKPWEWQVPAAAPVDDAAELRAENARLLADRDALRARIEAGVVVWGSYQSGGLCFAGEGARDETDTHTALLIDATPINHIADAGDVADERVGMADRKAGSNE